jgi:glycosyltransferase involved in cell wall biosynthesis
MTIQNIASRPTISVVSGTYNRSRLVCEMVRAAYQQTMPPDEIVVSDDCSPDDSIVALRELQREIPVLKIIVNELNSGGVPNWNKAIDCSSGELIVWCSDDDQLKPQHLENAVRYLMAHDDVDMVHAGFEEAREHSDGAVKIEHASLKSVSPVYISRDNLIPYLTHNYTWPFHPSTLVFRRKLWEETKPFNSKYALADTEWFIRVALHHRSVYLPYVGVINRRHYSKEGNWSNRVGSVNMQREFFEALSSFLTHAKTLSGNSTNFDLQFRVWLRHYRLMLLRIFVARSRAGMVDIAKDCAKELKRVTPCLSAIPSFPSRVVFVTTFEFLNLLQYVLPGGKKKYNSLGKHVPK